MLKLLIPIVLLIMFMNLFWELMIILMFMFMFLMMMIPSFYSCLYYKYFFLDNLSFSMIILSFWIIILMYMSMEKFLAFNNNLKLLSSMLLLLLLFLLLSFFSMNWLMFYIFFEMSLIPTFYLILGWGYQPERINAGIYLLFYTLIASLPLLMGIFYLFMNYKSLQFNIKLMNLMKFKFLFFSLIMAFLVKLPLFMVHLWLPKAHVEAPISGSMILAAVLLKLGGYGLLRVLKILLFFKDLNILLISISLYGGVLISLNCLRQIDLKLLIAYSSVAHMGLVLSGIMTLTFWGIYGSFIMMIAHGLCSSGLFCLANITYERLMSRSMLINKGLMNFMPSLSMWWFLLCSSNMSAPMSLNLISEINLINSIMGWSIYSIILIFMLCFFSASYSLYLFAFSQHGLINSGIYSFSSGQIREYLLLMLHWMPLNLLFLKMMFFYM